MHVDELSVFTNTETDHKRFCYMYNLLWDTLAQISTKLLFPRNDYDTYSKSTSEIFVFPSTCPRTITLTFPPLIYTTMFQNLLFNNVNIKSFIDFVYVFESACIKCVYAITHMSDYPLYVKYN